MISKKKKLSDFIIDEIKLMLNDGRLKEGEKLPNQNEFARQLGVSRLSLREALNTLSLQGVISQQPGVGTIVLSGNPTMWAENQAAPMLSDSKATTELLETRKHLEVIIAKCATDHIVDSDIGLIEEDINRMRKAVVVHDTRKYLKADMAFHYHIASSSHNRYIISMFLTIRNLMEEFMLEAFKLFPELIVSSFNYHMKIFESIKSKDAKRTSKYLLKHLEEIESKLKDYYSMETAKN
ncbi:MAG: FadR/GntR family transcriptional regulator [Candidatus Shapirobacteria bacterium]|jgi:GntR family transcriptional repressor for pyruvate dehydrogenase complex